MLTKGDNTADTAERINIMPAQGDWWSFLSTAAETDLFQYFINDVGIKKVHANQAY